MEKVVIITAASRGIGKACALKLYHEGCTLSLMSRSEAIIEVAEYCNASYLQGDISKPRDLEKLVQQTISKFGRIDGVINNTGHTPKGTLEKLTDEDWNKGFELAFLNVTRMAKLVLPHMLKLNAGSIVNISSFAAKEPSLQFPVSSVVRAGLGSYTKLFSSRFSKFNIRMNNILPGWVESYPVDENTMKTIPAGRPANPTEIGNLASFLISDEASYINGQSILIDGGLTKSF